MALKLVVKTEHSDRLIRGESPLTQVEGWQEPVALAIGN